MRSRQVSQRGGGGGGGASEGGIDTGALGSLLEGPEELEGRLAGNDGYP